MSRVQTTLNADLRRQLVDMAEKLLREWFGDDTTRETATYVMAKAPRFDALDSETRELVLDRFQPEHEPAAGLDYLPEPGCGCADDWPDPERPWRVCPHLASDAGV